MDSPSLLLGVTSQADWSRAATSHHHPSAQFSKGGLARARLGSFENTGSGSKALSPQGRSGQPGREAVHVGVGGWEGGGSAPTAGDAGSWSSAPPPAPPARPPVPLLSGRRRHREFGRLLRALALLRVSPFRALRPLCCPSGPRRPIATAAAFRRPGPRSGPARFGVSASREKSPPQASRTPGRRGEWGAVERGRGACCRCSPCSCGRRAWAWRRRRPRTSLQVSSARRLPRAGLAGTGHRAPSLAALGPKSSGSVLSDGRWQCPQRPRKHPPSCLCP